MARARQDNLTGGVGPLVGWTSDQNGAAPYTGLAADVGWRPTRGQIVSASFVGRETRERRLSHSAIIGIGQAVSRFTVGAAYEPIRRQGPWEYRLAAYGSTKVSFGKIGTEVRRSVHSPHRVTAHVDLVIPLK